MDAYRAQQSAVVRHWCAVAVAWLRENPTAITAADLIEEIEAPLTARSLGHALGKHPEVVEDLTTPRRHARRWYHHRWLTTNTATERHAHNGHPGGASS